MSEALIIPWVIAGIVFLVGLVAISHKIWEHARWCPKPDKSPREAREDGRRITQNFTVPVFSGVGVAAGLLGSWLLPHGAMLGDGGLISFAAVLMVICAALQALVNWVAVVGDPDPEVFYGTPERIYLGIQDLDVEDAAARQEITIMRKARDSWRAEYGARAVLSLRSMSSPELNESLAWVPPVLDLDFRGACRLRKIMLTIRARQACGYAKWVHGVVLVYVALAAGLLTCLVMMLQVQKLWLWVLALGILLFVWIVFDVLCVVSDVRKLARQKYFDSLLDGSFREADRGVNDAERRRQAAAEREEDRLNRIEDAVVRIEQLLAQKTSDGAPHGLARFFAGRWR